MDDRSVARPPFSGRRRSRALPVWLLLVLLLGGTAGGASTQQGSVDVAGVGVAEITGRVVDAESRLPLVGAIVTLERLHVAPGSSATAGGIAVLASWTAVSGITGDYRFEGLDPSYYRVVVARIGYLPTTIEVDLQRGEAPGLSVGLQIDPIQLAPLRIFARVPEPYARMRPLDISEEGGRLMVERLRRERYLVGDTRELTHAEVVEAITLAETDLFRALQRVPGVSTRDDYTATMWTRGASWDQTRVYFDGLPLFNPTHAGWLFSAVNPDAIGAASFHPGYRSARWGEGSAAVLDLRSRSGRSGKLLHGNAEISLASARLALDGDLAGRGHWMLAGRRSYVDLMSSLVASATGNRDLRIPYDFSDVSGSVNVPLYGGWTAEGSAILEYDHLRGDISGLLEGNRGRWGNRAGRIGIEGPVGPVNARISAGGTDFSTLIFEREAPGSVGESTLPALENAIEHRTLSLEIGPGGREGGLGSWAAGIQVVRDSVSYDGPFSLLGALISGGSRDTLTHAPFIYGNSLAHTALWGERRWFPGSRLNAITGLRYEFGDSVFNGGRGRLAPRAALRAALSANTALTAGWSRSFQYTQDVSPAAGPVGPQLHLSAIWVLASPARVFPAVRSDVTTMGLEHDWGDGWSLLLNGYRRDATGLKIPNPAPGAVTIGRDPDAEAENRAWGYEVTARRIGGRWTGSVAYSYGESDLLLRPRDPEIDGWTFPSSADIRHSLDGMGILRITRGVRIGGALSFGSGVPFTRLIIADGVAVDPPPPRLGEPNAERTPKYASLDGMVEYSRSFGGWGFGAYFQVRNILDRSNAVTYAGSRDCVEAGLVDSGHPCLGISGIVDQFEPGLPRLPLFGLRLAF